jgi:hypothetical protein
MSQTERDLDRELDVLDDDLDMALLDEEIVADDDLRDADEADEDPVDERATDTQVDDVEMDERDHDDPMADVGVDDTAYDDTDTDEPYVLPPIVMATEDDDEILDDEAEAEVIDPLIAREGTDVSDDVLEELRRADIDGPTVAFAPQDDTSSAIRRPRRSPDYDPAPYPIPMTVPRVLGRKPRVRRVTRVVRHVDPWSVFKIAIVANVVLYLIVLTAGVLLWNVAYATGTIDNVERFFESFGWSSFEFNGGEIYHNAWIGGLFAVIGLTGLAVLLATLFNLITDLVGGMRFTVLEEEVVEARPSPMRRFVVRRAEPEVPHISHDASGPIVREAIVDDSGSLPR